jgi:superfamily II DNA or RNA helicase
MSGTPFRADDSRIAELDYFNDGSSLKGNPDITYSYGEAFKEKLVAGVVCRLMGGEVHRYNVDGSDQLYSFNDQHPDTAAGLKACNERLRHAAVKSTDWQMAGIAEARKDLMTFRRNGYPWAGLVVCSTVAQATEIEKRITETYGDKCMLIVKDVRTSTAVADFKKDTSYVWAISITKISEGVSINRLRVGVYLSHVTSRSAFEQIRGRQARLVDGFSQAEQFSVFYVPADPRLKKYAEESNDIVAHIINLDNSLDGEEGAEKRKSGRAEKGDIETPDDTEQEVENLKEALDSGKAPIDLGKFTLFARHQMTGAVYDEEFFDEAKYLELRARLLAAGVPSHLASRMSEAEREEFLKIVEG